MRAAAALLLVLLTAGCTLPASLVGDARAPPVTCDEFVPIEALPTATPAPHAPAPSLPTPPIERDAFGVPTIRAETTPEIWRGIGRAMAEDRLWQMEHKRLGIQGRLAEVFGPPRLDADAAARLHRTPPEVVAGLYEELEPDTKAALDAYVAGINEVLRDPSLHPVELAAFGWAPAPWTPYDVVEIMLIPAPLGVETFALPVFYALDDALPEDEARRAFHDVVPAGDPRMPVSIDPRDLRYAPAVEPAAWPQAQLDAVREARPLFEGASGARLRAAPFASPPGGSNAFVIAPQWSASGAALLLGGPQVGYETPAVYWEARVESQGETWNVFVKPGEVLPRGRIGSAAFVLTTGYSDQHDLVLLKLDPADPERYQYGGETRAFTTRTEVLLAADRASAAASVLAGALPTPPRPEARPVTLRWSHVGPVLAHDAAAGWAVALQDLAPRGQLGYADVLLDEALPREAADPAAMRERLAALNGRVHESTNVLAAFRDGHISLHHIGTVPERSPELERRLPRVGDPATEPQRLWAPSCMPRVDDPTPGWIANWNNAPVEGWPHMAPRPWMWGASHRVQPLLAEIERTLGRERVDLADLAAINHAVAKRDMYAAPVIPRLVALAGGDARLATISDWAAQGTPMRDDDSDGVADHAGLRAFEAWRQRVQDAVFGDELGEADRDIQWGEDLVGLNYDDHGISFWTESAMLALLDGRAGHDWWDDIRTSDRETARDVLLATLDGLPTDAGPLPQIHLRRSGLGPELAMPQVNRGSINYLVDLGSAETWTMLPPGQSGHVGLLGPDPHVDDQLAMFIDLEYKVHR